MLPVPDVADSAELLLLTVPDAELPGLINGLAATGAVRRGTIVAHPAAQGRGRAGPADRTGLRAAGHPPGDDVHRRRRGHHRLAETCFSITAADEIGYAIAQALVLEIGGEPFRVREDARTLYHAALAHGSNHVVTVVADALDALRAALSGQELLGQETRRRRPGRPGRTHPRPAGPRRAGEHPAPRPGRPDRAGGPATPPPSAVI